MKLFFRKTLSWLLAGSLICALYVPWVFAESKVENEDQQTEKVKACIAQLGVGKETRVQTIASLQGRACGPLDE